MFDFEVPMVFLQREILLDASEDLWIARTDRYNVVRTSSNASGIVFYSR